MYKVYQTTLLLSKKVIPKTKIPQNLEKMWEGLNTPPLPSAFFGSVAVTKIPETLITSPSPPHHISTAHSTSHSLPLLLPQTLTTQPSRPYTTLKAPQPSPSAPSYPPQTPTTPTSSPHYPIQTLTTQPSHLYSTPKPLTTPTFQLISYVWMIFVYNS